MSKQTAIFSCIECNYKSIKWIGCCPECKHWDTLKENFAPASTTKKKQISSLQPLSQVSLHKQERMLTGISEWDRVVGHGIMPSSLIVLTGDPGIGKSTLLLQVSNAFAQSKKVFYFSTEESIYQVKQRAQRLSCINDNLLISDDAHLENIIQTAEAEKPDLLIIDSIQNCYHASMQSAPGSITQLRESTFQLMRLAKEHGITIILSGHINKEGNIAGPKTLEHMVDAVFYLQGEDQWQTRVLRSVKNRFGTINELGFFEMHSNGLQEITNINKQLLNEISYCPGSALISFIEGSQPLLLELQALTVQSKLNMPQRVFTGIDHKQVVLIIAILEKYLHVKLSAHDIFCKISGGFKIKGSSIDLGIGLALLSSYFQKALPPETIILGELGLTGIIKPINQINRYVKEAEKFGIKNLFIAKNQSIEKTSCNIQRFANVYELLSLFSE